MPTINLKDFSIGLLTEPDSSDTPLESMTVAENVDLTDRGKKKKQKGSLIDESTPTGVTVISFTKMRFTQPSEQDVTILYGQDAGGRDEIWWKPYWNHVTETWVDSWQELTEFEGVLTTEAGTVGDSIVCSGLASAVDDYYNRWVVLNVTRQIFSEVYDYDGGTTTLTLRDIVTSQTTDDTFLIYRFPLDLSLEGVFVADTGTNSTTCVVYPNAIVDDFYVGWTIYNTTRSAGATITAYDSALSKLTHGSIASQVSGDSIYLYKTTHDIEVESGEPVRFFQRENAVEVSVGVGAGFPTKAPLWFGYLSDRYFLDQDKTSGSSNNTFFSGFWMCRNTIDRPWQTSLNPSDSAAGVLANDTYVFRTAYIYDGYQEGVLSEPRSFAVVGGNTISLVIDLPLWSRKSTVMPSYWEAVLNKRITSIRLYAAKGAAAASDMDFFLLADIPIADVSPVRSDDFLGVTTLEVWTRTTDLYTTVTFDFSDDIWNGVLVEQVSGVSFGKFRKWTVEQGHSSTRVDANYRHRATLQETHYKAPIHVDKAYGTIVGYSLESNGAGVPGDDIMPYSNYLPNLGAKGANTITGLSHLNGELIILTKEKIFRYAPDQYLQGFFSGKGNVAKNGYTEYGGILYYTALDDIYAFNGNSVNGLMFGKILDQWRAKTVSNKESALMYYFENTNCLWVYCGETMFIYDVRHGHWKTYTPPATLVWLEADIDGKLYGASVSTIYELESDSFTQALVMHTKTKTIDFTQEIGGQRIPTRALLKKMIVRHSGGEKLIYKLYDPTKSSVYPVKTVTFFPGSKMPQELNVEVDKLEIDMLEVAYSGDSQPTHEILLEQIEFEALTS